MRYSSWMVTAAVLSLVGCGSSTSPYGGGGGGGGGGSSATITVGNDFFNPTPNTVSAGAVTFSWATPSNGHTSGDPAARDLSVPLVDAWRPRHGDARHDRRAVRERRSRSDPRAGTDAPRPRGDRKHY